MLEIKSFEFNPIQENTYILYNQFNECIIVDPGCYTDDERLELVNFITEKKLTPKLLLNTHCHLDHVFGNKFIAEKYNLILHVHENEIPVLMYAPASGLMYNLPFDNYAGEYQYLKDGELIPFGDDQLKVLLTAGHSLGSVSYYYEKGKFVLAGDALFYRSIGRTDIPMADHDLLIESIRTKLLTLPDDTVVYSGHGPSTDIGSEKVHNPFLQ